MINSNSVKRCDVVEKIFLKNNELLMKEWNYKLNTNVEVSNITIGSHKKVWWKCSKCGNEWQAVIKDRTRKDKPIGCPECKKRILSKYHETPIIGINDLESCFPRIAKEWNYEKNKIKLEEIKKTRNQEKFWWRCKRCGYEWQLSIRSKIVSTYCPKCATKVGINTRMNNYIKLHGSLYTNYPEIAKEWNYEKMVN